MRRHDTDWTSLVAGVTFCLIALLALTGLTGDGIAHWALPLVLIGLGLAGLAGTLVRGRKGHGDPE